MFASKNWHFIYEDLHFMNFLAKVAPGTAIWSPSGWTKQLWHSGNVSDCQNPCVGERPEQIANISYKERGIFYKYKILQYLTKTYYFCFGNLILFLSLSLGEFWQCDRLPECQNPPVFSIRSDAIRVLAIWKVILLNAFNDMTCYQVAKTLS